MEDSFPAMSTYQIVTSGARKCTEVKVLAVHAVDPTGNNSGGFYHSMIVFGPKIL